MSFDLDEFLKTSFWHNTVVEWGVAILLALVVFFAVLSVRNIVVRIMEARSAKKGNGEGWLILAYPIRKLNFLVILVVALASGAALLEFPGRLERTIEIALIIALVFQAGVWLSVLVDAWVNNYLKKRRIEDQASANAFGILRFGARVAVWSTALLVGLDNMGVDITTLVAGLGVGGIAIGLAAQKVLGDLFASFAIVLDKPFEVGDFIIVGDFMGNVEHVGIKTTRLRSLSGEQIVMGNEDLVSSRVRNYKRMDERRIVFSIGVTYQTRRAKVEKIPGILKAAVEKQKTARFDRAHFKSYGDFALIFEVVYYVLTPDYTEYMNIQEAVNLDIMRAFEKEKIEFAYPTQTIFLEHTVTPGQSS